MKRAILGAVVALLALVVLSGCGQVIGLVFEADLSVDYANAEEWDGNVAAVSVGFDNDGVWVDNVNWSIFLSADQYFDTFSDFEVYSGNFDIAFKGYDDEYVQTAWFNLDGVPDGDYFIIVVVDPYDKVDESNNDNNWAIATGPSFPVAGGTGGGGTTLYPDEWEPNNDFYSYTTLNMGWETWVGANLHDQNDVDWYEAHQMMDMSLTIEIRPGPNGLDVPVNVEVYNSNDPGLQFAIYNNGPNVNHTIYIDMAEAPGIDQWWRVMVYSPDGDIGEYEIEAY